MGNQGATQIIAYIVSGIGFLGAGVIMKEGGNVRGLNTAATLWCSGAVGAFCGAGLPAEATALTAFVLAANTLLRPLVQWVNRRPMLGTETEARYQVHVVCSLDDLSDVRDLLEAKLDTAGYPIREVETLTETEGGVEIAATLLPTSAESAALDRIVAALERSPPGPHRHLDHQRDHVSATGPSSRCPGQADITRPRRSKNPRCP